MLVTKLKTVCSGSLEPAIRSKIVLWKAEPAAVSNTKDTPVQKSVLTGVFMFG
jgi:hypothetical protein